MSNPAIQNPNTFLSGVCVSDVEGNQFVANEPLGPTAHRVLEIRRPVVERHEDTIHLGLPVFHEADLRCVIQLTGRTNDGISGVFEVWEPSGAYRDLKLTSGYFAHLERFQNVSSFVRFEQGAGLPGQAAVAGKAVVHDNLKQHPGFLRAAGASAGELQTALALPIFAPDFLCTVVLISSVPTPLAKCIEIWKPENGSLTLEHTAASDTSLEGDLLEIGATAPADGFLAESQARRTAVLCSDLDQLSASRACDSNSVAVVRPSDSALAIPTYKGSDLNSITLLWM